MLGLYAIQAITSGPMRRLSLLRAPPSRRELLLQDFNPASVGPRKLGVNRGQPQGHFSGRPQSLLFGYILQHVLNMRTQMEGDFLIKLNLATEERSGQGSGSLSLLVLLGRSAGGGVIPLSLFAFIRRSPGNSRAERFHDKSGPGDDAQCTSRSCCGKRRSGR